MMENLVDRDQIECVAWQLKIEDVSQAHLSVHYPGAIEIGASDRKHGSRRVDPYRPVVNRGEKLKQATSAGPQVEEGLERL